MDAANLHRIVPVGRAFYLAHLHELTEVENSDDSDDDDTWNKGSVVHTHISTEPSMVNSSVLGGLLAGYESSDDENTCDEQSNKAHESEVQEVPALSKVITFDAIECRIGNRVFRLRLSVPGSSGVAATNLFEEVFPPK